MSRARAAGGNASPPNRTHRSDERSRSVEGPAGGELVEQVRHGVPHRRPLGLDQLGEAGREAQHGLGHDDDTGADERSGVELEGRLVEVERGDVGEPIGRREVVRRRRSGRIGQGAAMAVDDPLRSAGRPRGVDDVGRCIAWDVHARRGRSGVDVGPVEGGDVGRFVLRRRASGGDDRQSHRGRSGELVQGARPASVMSTPTPASVRTDAAWSAGACGSTGTTTAPARSTLWTATKDSTDLESRIPTRSPGRTPAPMSAPAVRATRSTKVDHG